MSGVIPYIDMAIAFVTVMLMATTLVTFLTQFVMACLKARRKILEQAVQGLIVKLGLTEQEAKDLTNKVMEDPTIKESGGSVVRRERLIEILLDLATENPALQKALLGPQGNAENTLKAIRNTVLQLEATEPSLAEHVKRTKAILANTANTTADGIQKVLAGFDDASTKMTLVLQQHARTVTAILSLGVAIFLPLDAITVVKKLATDPDQVKKLVDLSGTLSTNGVAGSGTPASARPPQSNSENKEAPNQANTPTQNTTLVTEEDIANLKKQITEQAKLLTISPLGMTPALPNWDDYKKRVSQGEVAQTWVGILLAAALMSLGAPFWFDILKNLLNLRPALAQREEKERNERATTQTAAAQAAGRAAGA
jgi:hypothetical protein